MMLRSSLALLLLLAVASAAVAGGGKTVVLTSLDVTRALGEALAKGTSVEVRGLVPDGYVMSGRDAYFKKHREAVFKAASEADAVLTIRSVWPADSLYKWARRGNIRVADIDAASPLDGYGAGVPTINVRGTTSPLVWRSPANLTRMAAITAADLCRLAPGDAEAIRENLKRLQAALFKLRNRYEDIFLNSDSVDLAAFSVDNTYMADEFGLDIHFYELVPESRWTEADVERIAARLRNDNVKAVLCSWAPDAKGARAIQKGGATPVVVTRFGFGQGDDPIQSFVAWYDGNLSRMAAALKF